MDKNTRRASLGGYFYPLTSFLQTRLLATITCMNNTLESSKFFPLVAWAVVIGFAFFTFTLVMRLNDELSSISGGIQDLETRVEQLENR